MTESKTNNLNRLLSVFLIIIISMSNVAFGEHVIDDAGLFSSSEIESMEELVQDLTSTYRIDAVILTTYDVVAGKEENTQRYADNYYETNGYGLRKNRSGFLLLIDMTNRYNYISTSGDMIYYLNDNRIEEVLSSADRFLANGQYGLAINMELLKIGDFLEAGIDPFTFIYSQNME